MSGFPDDWNDGVQELRRLALEETLNRERIKQILRELERRPSFEEISMRLAIDLGALQSVIRDYRDARRKFKDYTEEDARDCLVAFCNP